MIVPFQYLIYKSATETRTPHYKERFFSFLLQFVQQKRNLIYSSGTPTYTITKALPHFPDNSAARSNSFRTSGFTNSNWAVLLDHEIVGIWTELHILGRINTPSTSVWKIILWDGLQPKCARRMTYLEPWKMKLCWRIAFVTAAEKYLKRINKW